MASKTKLSTTLAIIYAETGSYYTTQDQWWSSVFYSYCHESGNEGISNTYVSKYRNGERVISTKYTRYYSTSTSLCVPPKLIDDLRKHLTHHAQAAVITNVYTAMIRCCEQQSTYDRTKLLPDVILDDPDVSSVAALCAVVIWYAMCYDLSHV